MRIQDLENRTGLERPTIRYYEREGLLNPSRSENGYRDYSEENVQQLLKIKLLRQLGMGIEKIILIQQGSEDFSNALEKQVKILSQRIDKSIQARLVCETMRRDNVKFSTMDATYYLTLLAEANSQNPLFVKDFQEDIPKPIHPWRRFIARSIDYALLRVIWNFFLIVVFRIRPIPGFGVSLFLEVVQLAAFIPLEALMLHFFGTTPGKWIMGIQIQWLHGNRLPIGAAMKRSVTVWRNGMCCGIPFAGLFTQRIAYCQLTGRAMWANQKHDEIDPPSEMPWDEETEFVYSTRTRVQYVALACVPIFIFGMSAVRVLDSYKPKFRGSQITIEQFAANYNSTVKVLKVEGECGELDADGTWATNPQASIMSYVSGKARYDSPILTYETNGDVLQSITYTNAWSQVVYLQPLDSVVLATMYSALLGQDDINYPDVGEFTNVLQQEVVNESGYIQYGNIEIQWEFQHEGCLYKNGAFMAEDNQANALDSNVFIMYKIIIHN